MFVYNSTTLCTSACLRNFHEIGIASPVDQDQQKYLVFSPIQTFNIYFLFSALIFLTLFCIKLHNHVHPDNMPLHNAATESACSARAISMKYHANFSLLTPPSYPCWRFWWAENIWKPVICWDFAGIFAIAPLPEVQNLFIIGKNIGWKWRYYLPK